MPHPEAPNYQYPEDIPHVSGDVGTQALAVRQDVVTSLATLDGNYAPLQVNADGQLKVTTNLHPPVKFALISATLLVNTIVPLVSAKKIRVLNYLLSSGAAVNATWQGLAIPLSGAIHINKDTPPFSIAGSPDSPLFETPLGEPLILILSAATSVTGHLAYVEV